MKNGRPGTRSVCAERPPTKKLSAQERAKLGVHSINSMLLDY